MTFKYKDSNWADRETTLGDPAERAFETWSDHNGLAYTRYGLLRPKVDMRTIPAEIRYTPDYVTDYGLVEVQGCGQDGLLKFKHDKLDALRWWDEIIPVTFWFYHSTTGLDAQASLDEVVRLCGDIEEYYRVDGTFDGNKPYAAIGFTALL